MWDTLSSRIFLAAFSCETAIKISFSGAFSSFSLRTMSPCNKDQFKLHKLTKNQNWRLVMIAGNAKTPTYKYSHIVHGIADFIDIHQVAPSYADNTSRQCTQEHSNCCESVDWHSNSQKFAKSNTPHLAEASLSVADLEPHLTQSRCPLC